MIPNFPPALQVYLDPQSPTFFPKSWNPGDPCTCLRPDLLTSRDDSNGSAVFGKWWAGSWTTPSHGKKTHTQKGGCKCVYIYIYTSISTYIYTYIKILSCIIHIYIYTLILSWYPTHPLFSTVVLVGRLHIMTWKKWVFHQTSIQKLLFRVPGWYIYIYILRY